MWYVNWYHGMSCGSDEFRDKDTRNAVTIIDYYKGTRFLRTLYKIEIKKKKGYTIILRQEYSMAISS